MPTATRQVEITRPANTTAYTAADSINDTGGGVITIPKCAPGKGLGGVIRKITLTSSVVSTTNWIVDVMVFNTTFTAIADNATETITDAEILTLVGKHSFVAVNAAVTAVSKWSETEVYWPFECGAASDSLFILLVARGAYTPASGEKIAVTLGID